MPGSRNASKIEGRIDALHQLVASVERRVRLRLAPSPVLAHAVSLCRGTDEHTFGWDIVTTGI